MPGAFLEFRSHPSHDLEASSSPLDFINGTERRFSSVSVIAYGPYLAPAIRAVTQTRGNQRERYPHI